MTTAKLATLVAAILLTGAAFASAQDAPPTTQRATVYIPGLMPGPDRFGPFQRLCSLRVVGLVEWRVKVIDRMIGPRDAQKTALASLQAASNQARQAMAGVCGRERPTTSVGELDVMGKRLDAVTLAFKTVRPAYEAFYATLDAGQKRKIDTLGPQRQGWRW